MGYIVEINGVNKIYGKNPLSEMSILFFRVMRYFRI